MKSTIKSNEEISYIFSRGKRLTTPYVTLLIKEDDSKHGSSGRVAFIAGKKNGNAVWRNSSKRKLRSLCRDLGGPWPDKAVLFVAKKDLVNQPYYKVLESCRRVLSPYLT